MKVNFLTGKFIALMMIVSSALSFTSCDDDDDKIPVVSVQEMAGEYSGKMYSETAQPAEGEDAPVGTDIDAKVENNTIIFNSFPYREFVVAIVGEDAADAIMEMVGEVKYEIAYVPQINETKDGVNFTLKPEPLSLEVPIPDSDMKLKVNVGISAEDEGAYNIASTELKFTFTAESVVLGEGEDATPIEDFVPTTLNFELKKK